jgi:hypothetical protein
VSCPPNSFWNGTECECNPGFVKVGGNCQPIE